MSALQTTTRRFLIYVLLAVLGFILGYGLVYYLQKDAREAAQEIQERPAPGLPAE